MEKDKQNHEAIILTIDKRNWKDLKNKSKSIKFTN